MSLQVILNNVHSTLDNVEFHKDIIRINCSLLCQQQENEIILWSENPRTNILNIMYISRIKFDSKVCSENCFGILETKMFLCYNISCIILVPMEIMTCGKTILQFVIHFPQQNRRFLREIKLLQMECKDDVCPICYEKNNDIVKVDAYHSFCKTCLLKMENSSCPICRKPIF